jgi:hypothetical protein
MGSHKGVQHSGFCIVCRCDKPCPEDSKCRGLTTAEYRREYAKAWAELNQGYQRDWARRKAAGVPSPAQSRRRKRLFEAQEKAARREDDARRIEKILSTEAEEKWLLKKSNDELRRVQAALQEESRKLREEDAAASRLERIRQKVERNRLRLLESQAKRDAAKVEYARVVEARKNIAAHPTKPEKLAYAKGWHAEHPDRVKANHRKSYAKHREEYRLKRQAHPQDEAEKSARRRVKISAAASDLAEVREYYHFVRDTPRLRCYWCKAVVAKPNRSVDHIIALANGGSHAVANLCCSCFRCNSSKQAKDPLEFAGQGELNLS